MTTTAAPSAQPWVRHPADLARLVAALIGLALVLGAWNGACGLVTESGRRRRRVRCQAALGGATPSTMGHAVAFRRPSSTRRAM